MGNLFDRSTLDKKYVFVLELPFLHRDLVLRRLLYVVASLYHKLEPTKGIKLLPYNRKLYVISIDLFHISLWSSGPLICPLQLICNETNKQFNLTLKVTGKRACLVIFNTEFRKTYLAYCLSEINRRVVVGLSLFCREIHKTSIFHF